MRCFQKTIVFTRSLLLWGFVANLLAFSSHSEAGKSGVLIQRVGKREFANVSMRVSESSQSHRLCARYFCLAIRLKSSERQVLLSWTCMVHGLAKLDKPRLNSFALSFQNCSSDLADTCSKCRISIFLFLWRQPKQKSI